MTEFRKKKSKGVKNHLKKREQVSLSELVAADNDVLEKIDAALEEQKLRIREQGISSELLARQTKNVEDVDEGVEQFGLQPKKGKLLSSAEDEGMRGIATAFAEESGRMDRDKEMLKYIKEKLQETEGKAMQQKQLSKYEEMMSSLYKVPEHLQEKKEEVVDRGMLSSSILQGIPEVSLGIDEKIKNIEQTEKAKASRDVRRQDVMRIALGLDDVDTSLNYADARFDVGGRRNREPDPSVQFELAKRTAFDKGLTESVQIKPEDEHTNQKRNHEDDGMSADDRAFNAYRRRFKRY
eukprot:gene2538-5458_t